MGSDQKKIVIDVIGCTDFSLFSSPPTQKKSLTAFDWNLLFFFRFYYCKQLITTWQRKKPSENLESLAKIYIYVFFTQASKTSHPFLKQLECCSTVASLRGSAMHLMGSHLLDFFARLKQDCDELPTTMPRHLAFSFWGESSMIMAGQPAPPGLIRPC